VRHIGLFLFNYFYHAYSPTAYDTCTLCTGIYFQFYTYELQNLSLNYVRVSEFWVEEVNCTVLLQTTIYPYCMLCVVLFSLVRRSFRSKQRPSYVDTTYICLSVTYNQRLNCWSNCHEIRYRSYLQKFVWEECVW
jgi:hypothetical protein